ncbi:MAG: ribonuclease III [Clostridia bacterium]|nr:ribonuclease III [Clostridia bacterium]
MPRNFSELEEKIGYKFKKEELISTALTHSSYSNELRAKKISINCNERLEFLGDSVLSIIVSEYLFIKNKYLPEGELTKLRAELVCEKALSKYAGEIELGEYMYLGHGEEKNNGRNRRSIIADAFEALLAAIYLDSGNDKKTVSDFLMPFVKKEIEEISSEGRNTTDYKTALQQFVQQTEGDFLEYNVVGESGPDHMKVFEVDAMLNSNVIGHGSGRSKREAEQNAAKQALELFGEIK